jgi:hemerythrin
LYDFYAGSNKTKDKFVNIVSELKAYTIYHFTEEEAMLVKGKYPNIEEHKKIHKRFVDEISKVASGSFDYTSEEELSKLINFLSKWVVQHIRNEDYKYITYLRD